MTIEIGIWVLRVGFGHENGEKDAMLESKPWGFNSVLEAGIQVISFGLRMSYERKSHPRIAYMVSRTCYPA